MPDPASLDAEGDDDVVNHSAFQIRLDLSSDIPLSLSMSCKKRPSWSAHHRRRTRLPRLARLCRSKEKLRRIYLVRWHRHQPGPARPMLRAFGSRHRNLLLRRSHRNLVVPCWGLISLAARRQHLLGKHQLPHRHHWAPLTRPDRISSNPFFPCTHRPLDLSRRQNTTSKAPLAACSHLLPSHLPLMHHRGLEVWRMPLAD